MMSTARLLAISATIAQVLAVPALTNSEYSVTEGKAFDITWTNATGAVTLLLKTGASTDLSTYSNIASGVSGTSYAWTPENIPSGTYAIAISDSTGTNYSPQFSYQGTGVATSSAATTATSSAAAASSSTKASTASSGTAASTTATSARSSASATLTSTATGYSNGTTTASSTLSTSTKSSSSSSTGTSTTASSSTSTPINTNDAQRMGSPLALILLTAAALLICH